MTKQIRTAVSAIFQFEEKIFIIKRQNYLRSFPGYTAFPGGKSDKNDLNLLATLKREIKEELQFDIDEDHDVILLAKATSPDFNPTRFETYFYLINLVVLPVFNIDQNEFSSSAWMKPQDILLEFKEGKCLLIPPIRRILKRVDKKKIEFIDLNKKRTSPREVPYVETIYGLKQLMPLSNTIPPAERTNAFIFGDIEKVLVDPSPRDEHELQKLCATIGEIQLSFIMISHHHPDHHQYAVELAKRYSCPIKLSRDSYERIVNKSKNYFTGIDIEFIRDGDVLTSWLGYDVRAIAIPGHDEGHLGVAPDSMDWFIVGDLFQGVGTVVVGGAEGNMAKYIESLKKVIELNPSCVIPSHGIALGGTEILQKTLKHRLLREEQIFELIRKGKTIDQILDIIYFNIPVEVLIYAKANILSHIDKLKEEGKLI